MKGITKRMKEECHINITDIYGESNVGFLSVEDHKGIFYRFTLYINNDGNFVLEIEERNANRDEDIEICDIELRLIGRKIFETEEQLFIKLNELVLYMNKSKIPFY